jgi:hypothetical protein
MNRMPKNMSDRYKWDVRQIWMAAVRIRGLMGTGYSDSPQISYSTFAVESNLKNKKSSLATVDQNNKHIQKKHTSLISPASRIPSLSPSFASVPASRDRLANFRTRRLFNISLVCLQTSMAGKITTSKARVCPKVHCPRQAPQYCSKSFFRSRQKGQCPLPE